MYPLLFRKWVPKPLRLLCIFFLTITTLLLNGAYTGSSIDISSSMGVLREDISMAFYASAAGMAAAYPMVSKLRALLSTKRILLYDLLLQICLSYICANAQRMETITVCSFLIGFLKSFVMMEMILMLRPLFSPKNIRSEFYAYFYPMVFSVSQVSLIITAFIAYNFEWQYMYYLVIIMILISITLILSCFRYTNQELRLPADIDWYSFTLIASIYLTVIYVVTYGKTYDWFASSFIKTSVFLVPALIYLVIRRQKSQQAPYIALEVFQNKKAVAAYCMMLIVVILTSCNYLVTNYVNMVIQVNSYQSNLLNLAMIPGYILGGFICFWWFRLQVFRFRTLVFWGMLSISIFVALLYFGIASYATYEALFAPMFFRGLGSMIIFIAFGVYAVESLPPKWMLHNAFFLVSIRSTLAPAIGTALFSNWLYHLQASISDKLGAYITADNPVAYEKFISKLNSALSQGYSYEDASTIALKSINNIVQAQSTLVASKMILGIILTIALIITLIVRFIPFHKTLKVKAVKTGEDMI